MKFSQEPFHPYCVLLQLQLQKGWDWGQRMQILERSQGQEKLAASALSLSFQKLLHTSSLRNTPPTTAFAWCNQNTPGESMRYWEAEVTF